MIAGLKTDKIYKENAELLKQNAALKMEITSLANELKWLKEQLGLARKRCFGSSSEQSRYDMGQLLLFDDPESIPGQEASPAQWDKGTIGKPRARKTRLTTDKLPRNIPTEIIE
jgi:hypothetical protein